MAVSNSIAFALALTLGAALPGIAHAQGTVPAHLGIGAGVVTPSGSTNELDPGYRVQAALQFNVPLSPIAVRAEGFYMRLPLKSAAIPPCVTPGCTQATSGHDRLTGGEANAILQIPLLPGFPLIPYVMGGGGLYSYQMVSDGAINPPAKTNFGFDLGAGAMLHVAKVRVSLDARFEKIRNAPDLVPVTAIFWF